MPPAAAAASGQFELESNASSIDLNSKGITYPSIARWIFTLSVATSLVLMMLTVNFSGKIEDSFLSEMSWDTTVEVITPGYDSQIASVSLLPWDVVAEPARPQTIRVSSFYLNNVEKDVDSNFEVTWYLGNDVKLTGQDAVFQFDAVGIHNCTVVLNRINGLRVYETSFTLAVKYVRREIRSLTDEDRNTFFDALYKMYTIDDDVGKQMYGEKFKSAEYYVYKHLNGAGTTDCDHWHDGAGIVTHHVAFTLEVEQTLQAINASVAMPYWEYGMDSYLYDDWKLSPIFNADWFGEASPLNAGHAIADGGMWEGILLPDGDQYSSWDIDDTGTLNPFVNAYGQMRSPWNNNPIENIGRHNETYSMSQYNSMPNCPTLEDCFASTSIADMNDCLNGATHGPVHILIGGAWGEGTLFDDESISFMAMPDKLLFFKVLWRMGFTRCPSKCNLGKVCKCAVPDEYLTEYGAKYILEQTNVYYAIEKYVSNADDKFLEKVVRSIEDPGIAGEMFSSAAAFDPTFWPLHGAAERLVGFKRVLVSQGDITDFDETWDYKPYDPKSGAAYVPGVCDWSKVAGAGDLTLPDCDMSVTCFGHNADDLLEFTGFVTEDDAYTNEEFYNFIHPWNEVLPYTYDDFGYDYCETQGTYFMGGGNSILPEPGADGMPTDGSMPTDGTMPATDGSMPTMGGMTGTTGTSSTGSSVAMPSPGGAPGVSSTGGSTGATGMQPSANGGSSKARGGAKESSVDTDAVDVDAVGVPSSSFTYKGYAEGKSAPAQSTRTAPKAINTQPIKATQMLSEDMKRNRRVKQ